MPQSGMYAPVEADRHHHTGGMLKGGVAFTNNKKKWVSFGTMRRLHALVIQTRCILLSVLLYSRTACEVAV